MHKNKAKELLRTGGAAFGTNIFEFGTTGIARIVAEAGADFIFLDMEHTGWNIETIRIIIASTSGLDLVPVVRPPALQKAYPVHSGLSICSVWAGLAAWHWFGG